MKQRLTHKYFALLLAAALVLLPGCSVGGKEPEATATAAIPVAEGAFGQGSNAELSLGLLYAADGGGNEVIGTAGLTGVLAALRNALGDEGDPALDAALGTQELSLKTVNERASALHTVVTGLKNGRFASAWGLFVGENQAIKEEYLVALNDELQLPTTFEQLEEKTANTVLGSWADDNTGGRVKAVSAKVATSGAPLFLDLITADPDWQQALDPAHTKALDFTTADGSKSAVPTLVCQMNCGVYTGEEGSLAVLPCQGDETRIVVLLPPEGGDLKEFLKVAGEKFDGWLELAEWQEQRVLLPRASLRFEGSTKAALKKAGYGAFFAKNANLDAMGDGLQVADVLQMAELTIDESGVDAADETADYSPDADDGVDTLAVNRPFAVLLQQTKTGAILMAGLVRNPLETAAEDDEQ